MYGVHKDVKLERQSLKLLKKACSVNDENIFKKRYYAESHLLFCKTNQDVIRMLHLSTSNVSPQIITIYSQANISYLHR